MDISTQSLATQAYAFAVLAKAAYLNDSKKFFEAWDLHHDYLFLDNDGANGHIGSNTEQILITIRGTEVTDVKDLLADAKAWPKRNGVGWVHSGFRQYARKLLPTIMEYVATRPGRKIYIAGHSLGAAMALYITQELEFAGYTGITLFTYGCPRLGNNKFVKQIKAEHHRFVNCADIVACVPPTLLGYRHHGTLHYINFRGKIAKYNDWEWFLDTTVSRAVAYMQGTMFDGIADHSMIRYVDHLSQIDQID